MKNLNFTIPAWVLAFSALLATTARANDRSVTVSGSCVRQVMPDRGAITLTAEFTDPDLRSAARKASESYERVRDASKRLGLPHLELQTTEYQVQEVREWEKSKMVSKGFRARMGLRISSSAIDRLGEVIAIASREGIRDVGSLTTFLSDEKTKAEQFACLEAAAENAKAKADKLAGSLNASVGEVIRIQEDTTAPAPVRPVFSQMAFAKAAPGGNAEAEPQVEAKKQEVTASVQAVFRIK